jgi:hypothetical protein
MKFEFRTIVAGPLMAGCMLSVVGCGGGADVPAVFPVTGVILRDGAPLANANVEFLPDNGRPSSGSTDKDGKFVLEYLQGARGALKGSHKIRVAERFQGANPESPSTFDPNNPPPEPKSYNLPQPVQVNATTNKFVIDVTAGTATSSS